MERTVLDDIVDALEEPERIKRRERRFLLLIFSPAIISGLVAYLVTQFCL